MLIDSPFAGATHDVSAWAAGGEAAGYDGLVIAELAHDPFIAATVAGLATDRVRVATGVAIAFARNPMTVAASSWDLQRLTGGRFALGLGSQIAPHITRRFSMPWSAPASRMREFILAVRAIWECWQERTPLRFRGEHYTHTLMTPMFDPGRLGVPGPPILLAAVGPHMLRVAAQVADGLVVHPFTTPAYLREVTLPALASELGDRSMADFEVDGQVLAVSGRTDAEFESSRRAVSAQIAFYGSTPAYRPVLAHHGLGDVGDELHRLSVRGGWAAMADLIDDDILDLFAVQGSPAQVAAGLTERYADLLDRATPTLLGAGEDVGAQVAGRLRAAMNGGPGGAS